MQITIKEIKTKTGKSDKGPWELIILTSEDGTEITTFDKKAKLPAGSVIEFEPIIKEGKISFKECTVISEAPTPPGTPNGMTPEKWTQKDKLQRDSIESQVAAKLIIELRIAGCIDDKHPLYKKVLDWCSGKLGVAPTTKEKAPSASQVEKDAKELWPEGSPVDELFDWVATRMNFKNSKTARTWIVNVCKIPEERITSDTAAVKLEIAQLHGWTI